MVRYGLARSRSHTFNILIEKGLNEAGFWEQVYKGVKGFERPGFKIAHGGLSRMLEEKRHQLCTLIQTL